MRPLGYKAFGGRHACMSLLFVMLARCQTDRRAWLAGASQCRPCVLSAVGMADAHCDRLLSSLLAQPRLQAAATKHIVAVSHRKGRAEGEGL